jgi:hypothetical protein
VGIVSDGSLPRTLDGVDDDIALQGASAVRVVAMPSPLSAVLRTLWQLLSW